MKKYIISYIKKLYERVAEYNQGLINYSELKKISAGFGVYMQRNKNFMVRVRITGGDITTEKLNSIYFVMKANEIPYFRLSTRQNIQLHDVLAKKINKVLDSLIEKGFIFRGGGGDTFRSIPVSYDSGISKKSVFDVVPYAKEISELIYPINEAFSLPRKIKIAFSSDETDTAFAKWQDLGFIAKRNEEGKKGFKVYIGGGMGRESIEALKFSDFVPDFDIAKYCMAMISLFSENGDRINRNQARIRFIRKRMGDKNFIDLYKKYLSNTTAEELVNLKEEDVNILLQNICTVDENNDLGYDKWIQKLVENTKYDGLKLVKLLPSQGDIKINDLKYLINLFSKINVYKIRISRLHELCILVNESDLSFIYNYLTKYELSDFLGSKFDNHILSCTGATVCSIGHCNSRHYAEIVGNIFVKKLNIDSKPDIFNRIRNLISISGCPNCCGNTDAFDIGINMLKGKIDGVIVDKCKVKLSSRIAERLNVETILELDVSQLKNFIESIVDKLNKRNL